MDALPDTKLTMPESWRHSLCHLFNGNFQGEAGLASSPFVFFLHVFWKRAFGY